MTTDITNFFDNLSKDEKKIYNHHNYNSTASSIISSNATTKYNMKNISNSVISQYIYHNTNSADIVKSIHTSNNIYHNKYKKKNKYDDDQNFIVSDDKPHINSSYNLNEQNNLFKKRKLKNECLPNIYNKNNKYLEKNKTKSMDSNNKIQKTHNFICIISSEEENGC